MSYLPIQTLKISRIFVHKLSHSGNNTISYGMGTCIIHGYQQQGFPKTPDRAGAMVAL